MRHLDEHLDDGIIHALLDGELSGDELAAARAHVLACEACSARVAEERLLAGEAERLIAELDGPASAPSSGIPLAEGALPLPEGSVPPPPDSPTVKGPPVVLIPDVGEEPNRWQRRKVPSRWIGMAATLVIAAGAGLVALESGPDSEVFDADAVVSDLELLPAPEAQGFALTDSGVPAAAPDSPTGAPVQLAAETSAARPEPVAPAPVSGRADRAEAGRASSPDTRRLAAGESSDAAAKAREEAAATPSSPPAERAAPAPTPRNDRVREPRDEEVASVAQRRDSLRASSAPTAATPARRRAPLSLEEQSQISMRIGLDEAQRLLGGPMHVIDGLQPEFVGLVPGRLVSGANPNDYVVRVVYLDDQRRKI